MPSPRKSPRKLTPYNKFFKEHFKTVRTQVGGSVTDTAKEIGGQWRSLSPAKKAKYGVHHAAKKASKKKPSKKHSKKHSKKPSKKHSKKHGSKKA